MQWEWEKPVAIPREIAAGLTDTIRENWLKVCSSSLVECLESLGKPKSQFDLLAIESKPVLEVPGGLLVLDQDFLWRRCTSGLFWMLNDHLRSTAGVQASGRWHSGYGGMVEALAEDSIRSLAPPDLSGAPTFFTEDDFEAAYGRTDRCDAGVDLGNVFLLIEIVSGQFSVPARVEFDLDQLEKDFDRLVIGKCRQLHGTSVNILRDEMPLTGLANRVPAPRIVPVLVVGGGVPLNALSSSYVSARLEQEGFLQDPRVKPLCILNLENLENLESLHEKGMSPGQLLIDWQASGLKDMDLHNYLYRTGVGVGLERPARMTSEVERAFEEIIKRLGMSDDEPPTDS